MGYRHQYSWNAPLKDAAIKFPIWSKQVQAILNEVQRRKIVVWEKEDEGDLLVQRDLVKINGPTRRGQGYQALLIRFEECQKPTTWQSPHRCVTLGKPYEVAVVAALLQFGALFPEVQMISDGGLWLVGLDICQHLFKTKAAVIPETIALEHRWALPAPYRTASLRIRSAADDA